MGQPSTRRVSIAGVILLGLLATQAARAGSGRINPDGTIDLTANFRFPAHDGAIRGVVDRLTAASALLWDATEGQMRIGKVKLTCSLVDEDLADYWILSGPLRSSSCVDCLGVRGGHVNQDFSEPGYVYAHEFGHLGLALFDEYAENETKCNGQGQCIRQNPPEYSAEVQCLMQGISATDWSEFCEATHHDLLRDNNTTCKVDPPDAGGAPCKENCLAWNVDTHQHETTNQTRDNAGESCWQTLVRKFPFLRPPAGLPRAAPPPGFVPPEFDNRCRGVSTVSLLLDTSVSMELSVAGDKVEVCMNSFDDDGDGKVDEKDDCTETRLAFLKAVARGFVDLSRLLPYRVNLLSFDSVPREHLAFVDAKTRAADLKRAIDLLRTGGLTAMGDALEYTRTLLVADRMLHASKAVLLITDGEPSAGTLDPKTVLPAYQKDGIRIFALGAGQAANSKLLRELSAQTRGTMLPAADGTTLVTTAVEQFATYGNFGIVAPQQPFSIDREAEGSGGPPRTHRMELILETGTRKAVVAIAGSLGDMSGFGVRATLRSPSGIVLDSLAPKPGLQVVEDRFFTLLLLDGPESGRWMLEISGLPSAARFQTGHLIVISDNPEMDLFADLDTTTPISATDTAHLTLFPYFTTGLAGVDWTVRMRRPDGVEVPLVPLPGRTPYVYQADVAGFPWAGRYDLSVEMKTSPSTTNDPGESRPGTAPSASRTIPALARSLRLSLFRPGLDWYCQGEDCDSDGVIGESRTADGDGDGVPDAWDPDSDNDEVPDGREARP